MSTQSAMSPQLIVIDKDMALQWRSKIKTQRKLRRNKVAQYCRERMAGRWILTHQGMAFDVDGHFIDGQHRLEMVIETGMPTPFWVFFNCPKESIMHVDEQLTRSVVDSLKIAGEGDFSNRAVAIARVIEVYPQSTRQSLPLSKEQTLALLHKHSAAIDFAMANLTGTGSTKGVRTVVARAFYHLDLDRLEDFCRVVVHGFPVSTNSTEDSAAIAYRNYLLKYAHLSDSVEHERYCKGQTCIDSFMKKEPMTKVYGTEKDLFPLPDELQ